MYTIAQCNVQAVLRRGLARRRRGGAGGADNLPRKGSPISLLGLSLLRFVDSSFPGSSPWTWEFNPLELRICFSQTL